MNRIYTLISVLLLLVSKSVYSQTGDPADVFNSQMTEKTKPRSPNAAALEKVSLLPTNLSTGTAEINIPIFTVEGKKISLPISLSYQAKGIKVEEDASWVGLGWTLNAGGAIMQKTQGLREAAIINNALCPIRASDYDPTQNYGWERRMDDYFRDIYTMPTRIDEPAYRYKPEYIKDPAADIYTYNFCGQAGKFLLKNDGSPIFSPKKNFKVNFNGQSNITVVDDKGDSYFFSMLESTWTSASENSTEFLNSLYLTKITSADGSEVINLSYASENHIHYSLPAYDALVDDINGFQLQAVPYIVSGTDVVRLTEISTNFGIDVKFTPDDQNRIDLLPGNNVKTLKSIQIYQNNSFLKSYTLDKEYVKTSNELPAGSYSTLIPNNNYLNYRLYLRGLKVDNGGSSSIPPYIFEYYGRTSNNLDSLPHKFSYAQDHWGFYNGQLYNNGLCPGYVGEFREWVGYHYYGGNTGGAIQINAPNANREPSFIFSRVGTIKKVTYPTGAVTTLFYEPHSYQTIEFTSTEQPNQNSPGIAGGVRIQKQIVLDPVTSKSLVTTYSYANGRVCNPVYSGYVIKNTEGFISLLPSWLDPNKGTYGRANIRIAANSIYNLFSYNGSHIMYSDVSEKQSGNGYTNYNFSSAFLELSNETVNILPSRIAVSSAVGPPIDRIIPFPSYGFGWGTAPPISKDWIYGKLLSKRSFNEANKLISQDDVMYNRDEGISPRFVDTLFNVNLNVYLYYCPRTEVTAGSPAYTVDYYAPYFYYYRYPTYMGTSLETITNKKVFDSNNNSVEVVEHITYNSHLLPYIVSTLNSDGTKTIKKYKYPYDYDFSCSGSLSNEALAIKKLIDRNMVATPIEEQTLLEANGVKRLTSGKISTFTIIGENVFPQAVYSIDTSTPLNDTTFSYIDCSGSLIKHSLYKNKLLYTQYDGKGNLSEYLKPGGAKSSVIWKQNSKSPIAVIANASLNNVFYESFEDMPGTTANDAYTGHYSYTGNYNRTVYNLDNGNYTLSYWTKSGSSWTQQSSDVQVTNASFTININGQVDDVRLLPVGAQMTTYTYDTLLGMTSMTDPKGQTTFYEYDYFQRLYRIKDRNGRILKQYCYNYAGQQTDCSLPVFQQQVGASSIYARVEVGNVTYVNNSNDPYQSVGNQDEHADVYIRFYSDEACTTPYVIPSSMDVDMQQQYNYSDQNGSGQYTYINTYTATAGFSEIYLGNITVGSNSSYNDPYYGYINSGYNFIYTMVSHAGSNYTPESTIGSY